MKRSLQNRYNAKARQSSVHHHQNKRRKTQHQSDGEQEGEENSNASILHIKSAAEKEEERKARLLHQLMEEKESSKWTSQKKKRLEKYVEKKLQQEEKEELLKRLAKSQLEVGNTAKLQSSAFLGTGKGMTHQDVWDKEKEKSEDALKTNLSFSNEVGSALRDKNSVVFSGWKKPGNAQEDDESSFDSSDSALDSSDSGSDSDHERNEQNEHAPGDEDTSDESSCDDEASGANQPTAKKRSLGFKAWAAAQLDKVKGHHDPPPTSDPTTLDGHLPHLTQRKPEPPTEDLKHGPLGVSLSSIASTSEFSSLALSSSDSLKPSISRKPEIQDARLKLPILSHEHEIVETILLNPVTIIQGETGCGKTTQVVQFLYEAGFGFEGNANSGMIGITQPRRVAAVSTAQRVSEELTPPLDHKDQPPTLVGYQIRYQASLSPQTRIKFMTDGVLLREMQGDFLLSKYSVIAIDEAHERSINTDILIGLLSRIVRLREARWKENKSQPLRLIIMSASSLSKSFFGPTEIDLPHASTPLFNTTPPSLSIQARTHPVSIHFSKRTRPDYIKEALKKVAKIHTRLPAGGILVFLTGMEEIKGFIRVLQGKFRGSKRRTDVRDLSGSQNDDTEQISAAKVPLEVDDIQLQVSKGDALDDAHIEEDESMIEDPEDLESSDEEDDAEGDHELDRELGLPNEMDEDTSPMHILPLHSLLPSSEQLKVFQPPPEGHRLVVVSTNIAETSLTIPGISYVVDCGRAKERHFNHQTQTTSYPVSFVSKSSALQRAGRAGRTGPGHCYRLYSSALYEHYFPPEKNPEILNMSLENLVLMMKSMGIDHVVNFPFVTPPGFEELKKAEDVLSYLGALDNSLVGATSSTTGGLRKITSIGKSMALFPLSPRHARMLVSARQNGALPYVVTLVAALSVGDPFLREVMDAGEDEVLTSVALRNKRKEMFTLLDTHASLGNYTSDSLRLLSVVGGYEYAGGGIEFCERNFLRPKIMAEIHQFRIQLMHIVRANFEITADDVGFTNKLVPPSDRQLKVLRQLICASSLDRVAVRKDRAHLSTGGTKYATAHGVPYRCPGLNEDVFIHHSSVLAEQSPPEYIVYEEMQLSTAGKRVLKGVTAVHPAWLASLGRGCLCTFTKPVKNAHGKMMVVPRFGSEGWELPAVPATSIIA